MKICIVDRGRKIPALKYGGTERVIWGLGKELSSLGHHITFIVPEGSSSNFANIVTLDQQLDLNEQIPEGTDIVHLSFKPVTPLNKPYLVTMHGNPSPMDDLDINTVFVSKNHAVRHNSDVFVHNGLHWKDYPKPNLSFKRSGFHFLGKASWKVKNVAGAMKIAKKLNSSFHIIGGKKWTKRNLKNSIPLLFSSKTEFHGFLGDEEKMKIMDRSKGMIFLVLWHEPFGLAIIESLYAGCAVFGTENGSLKELITPEIGYTGNSTEVICKAMETFEYNPKRCHEYAVENFNSKRMSLEYLSLYERILNGEQLHEKVPTYNQVLNTVPDFN